MERSVLEHLSGRISIRLGLDGIIHARMENPAYAFHEVRAQYDAKPILRYLGRWGPKEALRVLGVTGVDIYVPILKYVFGLAEIEGRCALLSTHRLRCEFYDQAPKLDLLLSRAEKTAIHELGHTFGLNHCRDTRCVMHSSTLIAHTDAKGADFCPTCHELFGWLLKRQCPGSAPGM